MARHGYKMCVITAACIVLGALCANAPAAVRLELKLDKGKTYYERSVSEQQVTQEVMGQQQTVHLSVGIGQKLDVLDVDGRGNVQIRYTYIWTSFKQAGPMPVDYDSSQQTTSPSGAEGFAALLGQSYTVRLNPKGEVLDMNGVAEMAKAVREKLPPGTDLSSSGNPLASLLDEESLRGLTESASAVYPDKLVNSGDSWARTRAIKQGMAMINETKWTLQGRQGGMATIQATSALKVDPNEPPLEMQGMAMKFDLSGNQEGTIQMEETTGLIRKQSGRQELKGQIKIGTSPQGPFNMMMIPMTIATKFTVETSDRPWENKSAQGSPQSVR